MPEVDIQPPPRHRIWREARVVSDLVRMFRRLPTPTEACIQDLPVLLLPGFGAGHRAMQPLRYWLARQGGVVEHWGLGRNLAGLDIPHSIDEISDRWRFDPLTDYRGEAGVPLLCDRFGERLVEFSENRGRPVTLIGWSLGGTIAREAARDHPEYVSHVITLGSPIIGGPKYTAAASRLSARGLDLDWIERQVRRREEIAIRVPITAIVSPSDAIVSKDAAIDVRSPLTRHILLDVPHLGMAFNPTVWDEITRALRNA